MPRQGRAVFAGVPHHITQRGNRREDVFDTDEDREAYLTWLHEYCQQNKVEILAYCLMTNNIHLIALPKTETGLKLKGTLPFFKISHISQPLKMPIGCHQSGVMKTRSRVNNRIGK